MTEAEKITHENKIKALKKGNPEGAELTEGKETESTELIVILELSKEIDGKKEITLDFTSFNGFFLENCRKQYKRIREVKKETLNIESMDDKYYVVIASNLLDISYKTIMELPYQGL